MSRAIDVEKAIEIIETKQKELCPVGRYGRNYVYGSDREKYDAWDEIIDALENLPTLTPPNEWVSVYDRLPEPGERVLATDCGFVGEFYINKRGKWQRYNVNCSELLMALDILYWMPLPAPPDRRPPEGAGMNYIDRELLLIGVDGCISALHAQAKGYPIQEGAIKLVEATRSYIASLSAADVAPVRHGRWIEDERTYPGPGLKNNLCSVCGEIAGSWKEGLEPGRKWAYCPNCGARMGKEDEHEAD